VKEICIIIMVENKGKISFILVMNKEKFTNDGGRERNDDLF
jgi:hypothetical protein